MIYRPRPSRLLAPLAGLMLTLWLLGPGPANPERNTSGAGLPGLLELRSLGHLTTVAGERRGWERVELRGWLGGLQVEVDWVGRVTLGTDLRMAQYLRVDKAGRHVTLLLPRPEVIQAGLDLRQTRISGGNRDGCWLLVPGGSGESLLMARALGLAESRLRGEAVDAPMMERARGQAESVLARLFASLGWTVDVRWGT
jgi:hypothetical protein